MRRGPLQQLCTGSTACRHRVNMAGSTGVSGRKDLERPIDKQLVKIPHMGKEKKK
jgi:hypothetical protein